MSSDALLAFLTAHNIANQTLYHDPVFRVDEGEAIKAKLPGVHTKNLFLRDHRGQFWLVSAEQETVINLKTLSKTLDAGRFSFARTDQLVERLGVTPGSVTALALINDPKHQVRFVIDQRLWDAEQVNFHPLINTATTTLSQAGFRTFLAAIGVTPQIVAF